MVVIVKKWNGTLKHGTREMHAVFTVYALVICIKYKQTMEVGKKQMSHSSSSAVSRMRNRIKNVIIFECGRRM